MVELLHPGVYVLEVPSAVRPIEGVSTSTAAFIGVADKGPLPGTTLPTGRAAAPVMVTSLTDYFRVFGTYREDSFLTYAVRSFFDNGGRRLYIVRVAGAGAAAAAFQPVQVDAAAPGAWSSLFTVTVRDASNADPADFDLVVSVPGTGGDVVVETVQNLTAGSGGNAQANVGGSPYVRLASQPSQRPSNVSGQLAQGADGPGATPAKAMPGGLEVEAKFPGTWANNNVTVSIEDATGGDAGQFNLVVKLSGVQVEQFTDLAPASAAPPDPPNYAGTVVNGPHGSRFVRLPSDVTARPTDAPDVALTGGSDGTGGTAGALGSPSLSAANQGEWGNAITVRIGPSSDGDPDNFKLVVWDGQTPVESYDAVTYQGSPTLQDSAVNPGEYVRTVVNARSEYVAITDDLTSGRGLLPSVSLAGGKDGAAVQHGDYLGGVAKSNLVMGTGLHALDKVDDVNLVAIPGQGDTDVVNAGMSYCKNRQLHDCFFIGDVGTLEAGPGARRDDASTNVTRLDDVRGYATSPGQNSVLIDKASGDFGAVYYPWVWANDPIGTGRNPRILLPPSGFLAGLYARIDNSRGVFKAPAGTEAGVSGALAPAVYVSDSEQDQLNPISVNVIRTVPGSGIVVWGSRTIGSDASYRYVPVRRVAIFLRVSIYYGIQWAVFEPNDEPLWASLRLNIRAFMLTQFRAGAFQGSTPDEAFFVKCDSSTTTQTDIDNGVVNILVGFAPLKPAEFVVLRLSQMVNQPAT